MADGLTEGSSARTRRAFQFPLRTLVLWVTLCAAVLALAARVHIVLGVLAALALIYGWAGSRLSPALRIAYHLGGLLSFCAAVTLLDMYAALIRSMHGVIASSALVVLFSYPFLRRPRRTPHCALALACIAFLVATYFISWNSLKPFLRDLDHVEVGMTPAEVEAIMGNYIHGTGWPNPATGGELVLRGAVVYRHSNDGAYDSDWGIITFRDGRVVKVEFSAD